MKQLLVAALLSLAAGTASASIVENVHFDFESGASFNGSITFNDGYLGMIDADGLLSGGSYNYNLTFSDTWWTTTNQANPQNYYGQGWNDWLVGQNGNYIGLTWDVNAAANGVLSFVNTANSYTFGEISTNDKIIGWSKTNTDVPESSVLMLFGLGLLSLAGMRKLKKA